jgi:hypothetical protein
MKKTVIILSVLALLAGGCGILKKTNSPLDVSITLPSYFATGRCNPYQDSITGEYYFYSDGEIQFVVSGFKPEKKPVKTLVLLTGAGVKVGEKYSFSFGRKTYTFRAEGSIHNKKPDDYWYNVDDYKFYLSDGKNEQLVLTDLSEFDDTSPEILWLGDLDRDGKPDFVVRTRTWYEDEQIELYLSSIAEKGELVKLAGIATSSRRDEDENENEYEKEINAQ